MNHVQKFFVYQLLLMFSLFNGGQMLRAEKIPVFDETDEGLSDGEIAGLVAGSVAGLAVGATAIGVGIKKYQDSKKNNKKMVDGGLGEAVQSKDVEVKNSSASSEKRASFESFAEMHNAFAPSDALRPPTIDVNEVSEKERKILDEAFGEEAQKKEQRDQENQRRLDEKKKVYDDARVEWKKADKAVQDLQKQLMIYKNAPDINPDAKPPVIEAAEKERDRLYKVANEKQKVMVAHEQELKAVKVEIKQGFQAEAKALDALVEESTKRASEYKSRAAVVAEQQKADEQKAKNVQKDLEKKQQALQDAGMELHKANIAVADAGDALRNVKNENRYLEFEEDLEKKAKAEAKEKKAREKFQEKKAAVGRAQVHAERLAGEVDALEQKVQEIKLRPQAQEAHPVVESVVFEDRMERVRLSKNPMNAVLKGLPMSDEVKVAAENRQAIEDARAESKFKAQQEEARLKKMAEDRRTNKQKKKKPSTESARVTAEKNKKSFTGRVARRIAGH